MSYQVKKRGLYVCIASIVLLSQAIEAASYETASWKERLYSQFYSWWNKPRTPYPDWVKYAFVGGLGIAAIAATYTLWSQRSRKSKPGEQPTAPRKELTLEEQLRALDPTMADIYGYLADFQTKEADYKALLEELINYRIISRGIEKPLDIACALVWHSDKAVLVELLQKHKVVEEEGWEVSAAIESLFDYIELKNYLTKEEIQRIGLPYNLLGKNFGVLQTDMEGQREHFFFNKFFDLSLKIEAYEYPDKWTMLSQASNCIKDRIDKLRSYQFKRGIFADLLSMQTKERIIENLKAAVEDFPSIKPLANHLIQDITNTQVEKE